MRIIISLLLLGAVVFGGYHYFSSGKPAGGGMPMGGGMPVSVAAVLERQIVEWDEFSGRLEAVERVEIRPRIGGSIDAIHFQEGQLVKKGQALFTIDPRPYEAEVNRAEAALAAAKSQATYADTGFKRAEKLIQDKAISQREYDESKNASLSANANIKVAEAAVRQARLNLGYTHITAPISGRVNRAEITVGNLVGVGEPVLTTIVSLDPIYASFDADEQTFVKYMQANGNNPDKLKQVPVMMGLSGKTDWPYQGVVKSFDNELNTRAGTVRVRATFDNHDGTLIPGLFARIRIGGGGQEKAVLISERAVGTDQSKKFVYVIGDDNKANYREITLGPVTEGLRIVRTGLKAGEKIVVNGLQRVRPGAPVTPQMVAMDAADTPPAAAATPEKK